MKTNKLMISLSVLFITGLLAFTSCKKRTKKEAEEPDKEANTARDNARLESTANDIVAIGSQAIENNSLSEYKSTTQNSLNGSLALAPCATISVNGSVVTVDFGTTGCLGNDGRVRTGKLLYDLSASSPSTAIYYRNPGFKMIVTSQNYVVDSNMVSISGKTITNTTSPSIGTGTNTNGVNLTWRIQSSIQIVKPNGGGTITWSCDRTKELTNTNNSACYKGQLLPIDWTNAIVKLNGNASGTNAKGESYTANAINLLRDFTCSPSTLLPRRHPFISGKIEYKPGNRATRTIDYGNGSCDLNANLTINGVTYAITLP